MHEHENELWCTHQKTKSINVDFTCKSNIRAVWSSCTIIHQSNGMRYYSAFVDFTFKLQYSYKQLKTGMHIPKNSLGVVNVEARIPHHPTPEPKSIIFKNLYRSHEESQLHSASQQWGIFPPQWTFTTTSSGWLKHITQSVCEHECRRHHAHSDRENLCATR